MASEDNELKQRISTYVESQYQRYVTWYGQNAKLAKNNLIAAFGVVLICALAFVFFPSPMDQMSFLQYEFDPTNAIKLGLVASIALAVFSMQTSFKKMKSCLTTKAQLETEFSVYQEVETDEAGAVGEAAFEAFKSKVDGIMAASNPELVIAVERDNLQKQKSS